MSSLNSTTHPPPQHSTVPIVERLVKTYKVWQEYVVHFPKRSRYTLGQKIEMIFLEVVELVFYASITRDKEKTICLQRAARRFDLLKFLLRIAWEIKAIDNKKYAAFSAQLDEIGRMLGGWFKKALKQTPPLRSGGA